MAGPNESTGISDSSLGSLWSQAGTVERIYHKGLALDEGGFLIGGGQTQVATPITTVDKQLVLFEVVSTTINGNGSKTVDYKWTRLIHTVTAGAQNFGFSKNGDRVYITGGHTGRQGHASNAQDRLVFRRSPSVETFGSTTMPFNAAGHATAALSSEVLSLSGGFDFWNLANRNTYEYTDDAGWAAGAGTLNDPRTSHEAVMTSAGLLVIGGRIPFVRQTEDTDDNNYYAFDTSSSGNTPDALGGLTLALGGSSITNVGQAGFCVNPTGTVIATAGGPQTALNTALLSPWTVEGWMTRAAGTVVACGGSGTGGAANNLLFSFGIDGTGHFFIKYQHGSNVLTTLTSTDTASSNMPYAHDATNTAFHHFAIVKADVGGGNSQFTLYINGQLIETFSPAVSPSGGSAALLQIGSDPMGVTAAYTGFLDELRISKVARAASAVLRHYDAQKGCTYWDVPEGTWRDALKVGRCLESCELRKNDGTWARSGSMAFARFGFAPVVLPDGRVAVFGGLGYNASKPLDAAPLASCEIWDPSTKFWTALPSMAFARDFATASYVKDLNVVIVSGGETNIDYEILNLDTMTWSSGLRSLAVGLYRSVGGPVGTDYAVVIGGSSQDLNRIYSTSKNNYLFIPGSETVWQGGLNRIAAITTAPTGTTATYNTSDDYPERTLSNEAGAVVWAVKAGAGHTPGPYIFDPKNSPAITGVTAMSADNLQKNNQYAVLNLVTSMDDPAPALRFPNEEGYLVFNFGNPDEVLYPVRYFGRLSESELKLDFDFKFTKEVKVGGTVRLLSGRIPYNPNPNVLVGSLYATASEAGRIAALAQVDETVAAGVDIVTTVIYPGDRGLGGEGLPTAGEGKLNDIVKVFGGGES